jgi:hypothetical protein
MAEIAKLVIFKDAKSSEEFVAFINPSSISHKITINYNPEDKKAPPTGNGEGKKSDGKVFVSHGPTDVSFKIILDGTSITPKSKQDISKNYGSVSEQIALFKEICYDYNSDKHAPNLVTIGWGEIYFEKCSLTQLNINYTLFNQKGEILRAELDVSFSVGVDNLNMINIKNSQSPDMSRIRVLNDEDKLSLMCEEFYGDSSKQLQVAKENGIINFRKLKPGTEVYFPPIKK